jgi:hypothetical protein
MKIIDSLKSFLYKITPIKEKLELVEVFKDFEIEVLSRLSVNYSSGSYTRLYKILPKKDNKIITLEDLKKVVKRLSEKYPSESFSLIKKKNYYVITKKAENPKFKNVPIYFDLKNQKIYVEKEHVEKERKLTNYILMRTLGALGIIQNKYIGHIHETEKNIE